LASEVSNDVHQRDIERALKLTNLSINGLLNRLQEKKFIKWITDLKDSRARRIVLTENAQYIVDSIYKGIFQTEEMLLDGLSVEEIEPFSNFLRKIAENAIKKAN